MKQWQIPRSWASKNVKTQYLYASIAILVLIVISFSFLLWQMFSINQRYNKLIDNEAYSYSYVEAALAEYNKASSNLRGFVLSSNSQDEAIYYQAVAKGDFYLGKAEKLVASSEDREALEKFTRLGKTFKDYGREIITLVKSRETTEGTDKLILQEQLNHFLEGDQNLVVNLASAGEAFAKIQSDQLEKGKAESRSQVNRTLLLAFVVMILLVLIFIGVSGQVFRKLKDFSKQLLDKSRSVDQLSQELNAHCQRVAEGAAETASTTNEVAAAMEAANVNTQNISHQVDNLTNNISQIADNAGLASNHSQQGEQGLRAIITQMETIRQAVQQNEHVVKSLSEDTAKINQIISIINQVAEQTNLLALNAAIEAARAGEHGRGFAVVAEEVRKLAEQSSDSTKDIYRLLTNINSKTKDAMHSMGASVAEVQNSTRVVEEVSQTFRGIIDIVNGLSQEIQAAAAASEEMSSALQHVIENVDQVSSSIQNVAAAAEEQTASSEEISASTDDLTTIVGELDHIASKL